ncbi:MAG: hypothetical protein R3F20_17420 [Planctomycetota bacterium]
MIQIRTLATFCAAAIVSLSGMLAAQDAAPAPAAPKPLVKVAPKFKKGQVLHFIREDNSTVDMMGQGMVNKIAFEMTMTVAEVEEGGAARAKVDIGRVYGSMNLAGMMDVSFDSDEADAAEDEDEGDDAGMGMGGLPDPKMLGKMFTSAAGTSFDLHFDAAGRVTKVSGFPTGLRGVGSQVPDAQIVERFGAAFAVLPKDGVAVGSKFESGAMPLPGFKAKLAHEVTTCDDKSVVIKASGKVAEDADAAGGNPLAALAEFDGGKVESTTTLSREDGLPVEHRATTKIDLYMENEMAEGELSVTSEAVMKRVKGFEKKKAKAAEAPAPKDEAAPAPKTEAPKAEGEPKKGKDA